MVTALLMLASGPKEPTRFAKSNGRAASETFRLRTAPACPLRWSIHHDRAHRLTLCCTPLRDTGILPAEYITWCRRRDSNSHSFRHYPLKIACLPISPRRLYSKLSEGMRIANQTALN